MYGIGIGFDSRIDDSEYAVEIYENGHFVRQIDVYNQLWAAESYIERNKNDKYPGEFYHILRIDYDKDGNEIGIETVYAEEDELC